MRIVSVRDKENNRWKRKGKKDRKGQWGDASYSEIVRAKWFCCAFKFSLINM